MPISIPGKLRIKRINGSNGPFCVGDLTTEIGDFRVKDTILDQFDEGDYAGQFWIQQIYPWSYSAYGRTVIEIRAKLADMQIAGQQRVGTIPHEPQEPDPAKEAPPAPPVAQPEPPAQQEGGLVDADQPSDCDAESTPDRDDDPDRTLFGDELYAVVAERQPVKLDPTIDRIQFRLQRDRLKALGYSFQAALQSWQPSR